VRVLVADDDPISLRILETKLAQWDYDVTAVQDGDAAWEVLQQGQPPRLAVLDWMMPGRDGLQIVRGLRDSAREPYVYVLLLTARAQRQDLVEAMEAGADDYVAKPFDPQELRLRLRAGRRIVGLQEELMIASDELRSQATHDSLTGTWNRAAILDALGRELVRSQRERVPFSIAMADIDYFKAVNDRLGHQVGDVVLSEVARRMGTRLRQYDLVGRYGGEEFLIILPGCDASEAAGMVERLRAEAGVEIVAGEHQAVSVTISLGVSTFHPGSDTTCEQLIREADLALYAAKNQGRNRAVLAR
jgi:two-component system, cell cycle response regulator